MNTKVQPKKASFTYNFLTIFLIILVIRENGNEPVKSSRTMYSEHCMQKPLGWSKAVLRRKCMEPWHVY
jgi:hypothetical protein